MVKKSILLLFYFLCIAAWLQGDDVSIDAEVDQSGSVWENQPLKGLISITHNENDKVDESSFKLENSPLPVEFVREVRISTTSPLVISYYQFSLNGKPRGLQILPSVSAKVGSKRYQSSPSTYQVGEVAAPVQASDKSRKSVLKLESGLEGPNEIYPGTRFKVVYRYIFNDNIELTKEELPALQGTGFTKIGTQEANDSEQGEYSIRTISQVLEAVKPGTYKFDRSFIQGYVYRNDPFGGHIYLKPGLSAETPPMAINVLPFPEKGKPASFNGAVGSFSRFSVNLLSSPNISVGGKIVLNVQIAGTGQMNSVPLPDLCCQPGMSGVFQLSDLPPVEKITGNSKTFTVEMRPLIADIKNIPSIEFAYFIPSTRTYGVLHSNPIPITVKPLPPPIEKKTEEQPNKPEKTSPQEDWRQVSKNPSPIEISGIEKMDQSDLKNRFFGSWWVLWIIPAGILLTIGQIWLKSYLTYSKPAIKQVTSQDIFQEALQAGPNSPFFYQRLNKALMLRLVEKGVIKNSDTIVENLPETGEAGLVREFLLDLDKERFAGQKTFSSEKLIQDAKDIFERLK